MLAPAPATEEVATNEPVLPPVAFTMSFTSSDPLPPAYPLSKSSFIPAGGVHVASASRPYAVMTRSLADVVVTLGGVCEVPLASVPLANASIGLAVSTLVYDRMMPSVLVFPPQVQLQLAGSPEAATFQ